MTTEYRDGTIKDLKPGDGLSYKGLGASNWESEPSHEYVGNNSCVHVQYRHLSTPSQVPVSDAYNLRIWPGYFKGKEPVQGSEGKTVWVRATLVDENVNEDGDLYVTLEGHHATSAPVHFSLVSDIAPQPEFDVEAFRAKVEKARDRFDDFDQEYIELQGVLDLLPPKPQATAEEVALAAFRACPEDNSPAISLAMVNALRDAGLLREGV